MNYIMTDKCQEHDWSRHDVYAGQLKRSVCFCKVGSSCSVSLDETPQGIVEMGLRLSVVLSQHASFKAVW